MSVMERLSHAQSAALSHVAEVMRQNQEVAARSLADQLEHANVSINRYQAAMAVLGAHGRVAVHFHPDRLGPSHITVVQALLRDGIYRNQFETAVSNGSLTAFPGGARDTWEKTLFGGAYHSACVTDFERPKYGSLELVRFPDGPIPRFGSCYFVLRPEVSSRTSFTFMGSEDPQAPERIGTIGRMNAVMTALFAEIEAGGVATPSWPPFQTPTLGVPNLTIPKILDIICALSFPRNDTMRSEPGRVLDTQIEAQIHGPVDLRQDVELLVADPSFAQTTCGNELRSIAEKYAFPLQWHCGFWLPVRDVPDNFRGPVMPRLATRVSGTGRILDAAIIGAASASLREQPDQWREWGTPSEVLQRLKQLWHVLVHFGLNDGDNR